MIEHGAAKPGRLPDWVLTELRETEASKRTWRFVMAMGSLILAGSSLSASAMTEKITGPSRDQPLPAEPSPAAALPALVRPISSEAALAMNRLIPYTGQPIAPAPPFRFAGEAAARSNAIGCLTAAIYYEAGNQGEAGEEAVAQVVLNRVRSPAFPASICGVVFQGSTLATGCQFTFACDGSMVRVPDRAGWTAAQRIAEKALSGKIYAAVGLSTHYHADYVVPYWAAKLAKTAQVGVHIFYRWPRAWSNPGSFERRYSGNEPDPAGLRAAALIAHGLWPARPDDISDPPIKLIADPQLELIGILGLLGSAQSDEAAPYEREARSYFDSPAGASAAQLVRDLQSQAGGPINDNRDSSLASAVDAFAEATEFRSFFRAHGTFYRQAIAKFRRELAPALSDWETYTAMPVEPRKMAAAVGFTNASSVCAAGKLLGRDVLWVGAADSLGAGNAEILIRSGASSLNSRHPGQPREAHLVATPEVHEQIIRAVFTRIAALSGGEAAGEAAVRRELGRGFKLVPVLAGRLRFYERNRTLYPTLKDFLPVLTRGLSDAEPAPAIAVREGSQTIGCGAYAGESGQNPQLHART